MEQRDSIMNDAYLTEQINIQNLISEEESLRKYQNHIQRLSES